MKLKKTFKYIFIFISALMVVACGGNDEEEITIPSNVLNEEKYTKLLVDFALAESAGNLNIKNLVGPKFDSAYAFSPLKENNVSKAEYDSTISFYSKHPKLYKKLCDEVLIILSKLQITRAAMVKKDSVKTKDSLIKNKEIVRKDSIVNKAITIAKVTAAKKTKEIKKSKKKKRKKKNSQ